jgi:hypothetical protein
MKRDVLTSRDGLFKREAAAPSEAATREAARPAATREAAAQREKAEKRAATRTSNLRDAFGQREPHVVPVEVTIEPACEEPTWEVFRPGGKRRLDGRTRLVLTLAAVAAAAVNAGAAWMYWKVSGSEAAAERSGGTVVMALRGRSDLNRPLKPGRTGDLTVTVTNDKAFPIRITSVAPGPGNIVADDEHRDRGCKDATGVSMTRSSFAVSWEVARNTLGAYTIPDGLRMAADANPACEGAVFTVPVRVIGFGAAR